MERREAARAAEDDVEDIAEIADNNNERPPQQGKN